MDTVRDEVLDPVDGRVRTHSTTVAVPSLEAALEALDQPRLAWLGPGERFVAGGAVRTLVADGPNRFDRIRSASAALFDAHRFVGDAEPAIRPRLIGGFAFHDGTNGHEEAPPTWDRFADAVFVLPAVRLIDHDGETRLAVTAAGPDAESTARRQLDAWQRRLEGVDTSPTSGRPGIATTRQTPSRATWRDQVRAAIESIDRGDLQKVVLAQSLLAELASERSVAGALAHLGESYPDCYRFMLEPAADGEETFFGATPEQLVSLRGRTVRTDALAGSTGRGETPAEDEWLGEELLDSEKDNHEHDLVVDAIRDQLAPFAHGITTGERQLRRLATVQHLQTPITAELDRDEHVLSLVEALHPTPAVGGLPPDAALRTIRETEAFDRGWYAAPVGWFDAAGNGTFAVAIRSALTDGQRARLFAGAGIVADSDPDREWDEVQLKYRPMLDELE
jgi:menaquinone-specific isochorismate synthase